MEHAPLKLEQPILEEVIQLIHYFVSHLCLAYRSADLSLTLFDRSNLRFQDPEIANFLGENESSLEGPWYRTNVLARTGIFMRIIAEK